MKVVNAGLAARSLPGAAQPVYGGPLGRGASRVILHVDMDCFFVSVLVKNRPELKDKPVAVAHNGERSLAMVAHEISTTGSLGGRGAVPGARTSQAVAGSKDVLFVVVAGVFFRCPLPPRRFLTPGTFYVLLMQRAMRRGRGAARSRPVITPPGPRV